MILLHTFWASSISSSKFGRMDGVPWPWVAVTDGPAPEQVGKEGTEIRLWMPNRSGKARFGVSEKANALTVIF